MEVGRWKGFEFENLGLLTFSIIFYRYHKLWGVNVSSCETFGPSQVAAEATAPNSSVHLQVAWEFLGNMHQGRCARGLPWVFVESI